MPPRQIAARVRGDGVLVGASTGEPLDPQPAGSRIRVFDAQGPEPNAFRRAVAAVAAVAPLTPYPNDPPVVHDDGSITFTL